MAYQFPENTGTVFEPFCQDSTFDYLNGCFTYTGTPTTFADVRNIICVHLYKAGLNDRLFEGMDGTWGKNFDDAIATLRAMPEESPRRALLVNEMLAFLEHLYPEHKLTESIEYDGDFGPQFDAMIEWVRAQNPDLVYDQFQQGYPN